MGKEDLQGRLRSEFLCLFTLYLGKQPWSEVGSRVGGRLGEKAINLTLMGTKTYSSDHDFLSTVLLSEH